MERQILFGDAAAQGRPEDFLCSSYWMKCHSHVFEFTDPFSAVEFFNSALLFFSPVIYVWYFSFNFISWLKCLPCSVIVVLSLLNLFMTIILNSLLGKSLIFVSLRSVFEFCQSLFFRIYDSFIYLSPSTDLCALGKRAISPALIDYFM